MQAFGDGFEQQLLFLHRAPFADGDLNEHHAITALDPQILRVVDEMLTVVLGEDLEVVVLGHIDTTAQGSVDVLADAFGESGVGVLLDIDANQWNGKAPQGRGLISR